MFGKKKNNLKKQFDEALLEDIDRAFSEWTNDKKNQETVFEADEEMAAKTKVSKAQYELLYREARRRKVKGHVQSSVISR
ncbi:hypothetical protein FC65_GL001603 [Ligilactobacillus acidipiscis DSM 15836]|mgnify:CR=1 FL=1|jgi:hypothetical protein|uniref:DUF2508 domain-containing protein n=2 Tax=Ligilactobacillus acidipiscis TaxID=89059 RepID=A0A0R2K352_9LACO|nr:YaaL family protein [Ligilactobacillus acidipiscis]KRM28775.1 hypothetical protein FC65_GL001603 [Ligilactobacillus acidipiscis DSM 15836]KRN83835.1 hypothetical protein IV43_GL001299 [Ligilactobacillus acidipiscis]MCI1954117.1 YaaL family protein [Ligilactobacillus acidipiscis]WEV57747.1 YaaL family protein [Ligilactobacillus acidipiscis]SFV40219.1 FIG015094: hypothetical protein [Ligilactobacillus acidipiscis]